MDTRQRKPLIGITLRHELETERFYLARYYSEAVEAFGGVPVHVSLIPHEEYISDIALRLDGVLLPGSASDVDPLRYGREPHPHLGSVHPLKDETDTLLLGEVERLNIPLLAICFGMQIWNVTRGGTLIQDIISQLPEALKHEQGAPRDRHSHRLKFLKESRLARISGHDAALVNSHHHQGIEKVGRDLIATAWASDGLIEGVEDSREGRWAVGVQWHPEIGWETDEFSRSIFQSFVNATREFAEKTSER
ncbi:MAG: gamma-glutamyl-gamma-aminobutyrate hydrolase family protein, partial [Pyrinomonadaceae bacterium]